MTAVIMVINLSDANKFILKTHGTYLFVSELLSLFHFLIVLLKGPFPLLLLNFFVLRFTYPPSHSQSIIIQLYHPPYEIHLS